MKRVLLCITGLLLFPVMSLAQQIIRTGEHEGFTRIVIPLSINAEWTVEHTDRTVMLRVASLNDGFDLRGAFKPISRERILDITNHPSGLDIQLGCDCRVSAFMDQGRFVVLDIVSPGITLPTKFVSLSSDAGAVEARVAGPQRPPSTTRKNTASRQSPRLPSLSRTPLSDAEQASLDNLQRHLAQAVGSAATRGLLSPASGVRRPQVDLGDLALPSASVPEPLEPVIILDPKTNMRITSSMDMVGSAQGLDAVQSVSGLTCPIDEDLDIAAWADDRPFQVQASELYRFLYGEFDQLDPSIALRLAKLYVHFGFGAEAQQVLALDSDLANENRILTDIAAIMENDVADAQSPLGSLLDCKTDAALWAVLSRAALDTSRSIDPQAALRALDRLPVHLRLFLAPSLSRRFLAHGDADAASAALRSLERLPGPLPSSAKLAQAKIAINQGRIESGTRALTDVIKDNAEQSPEALIALVETQLAENRPLDPETARLIEAYAKELKASDLGRAMRRAHVLVLATSGQFDRAFDAMAEFDADTDSTAAIDLRLLLMRELIINAPDVTFLEHLFDQLPPDIDRLAIRDKFALVQRMVDLGFAEQAQEILAGVPARPVREERQMLAARIALELSQPMRALAELGDFSTQQANFMRARAKQMTGVYRDAADLYMQEGKQEEAARVAWIGLESDHQTLRDDLLFGPTLDLARVDVEVSQRIDGMLTRTEALLAESEAARRTLSTLLQAPDLQLPTPADAN